jgi:hypothetical protein
MYREGIAYSIVLLLPTPQTPLRLVRLLGLGFG